MRCALLRLIEFRHIPLSSLFLLDKVKNSHLGKLSRNNDDNSTFYQIHGIFVAIKSAVRILKVTKN